MVQPNRSDASGPAGRFSAKAYFGLSIRARRTIFVVSLLFIAVAFANPGGLFWNILVWIFAALFFLLLLAVLLRLLFPQSLRNWLDL